eukprot:5591744-Prymnesium_polylepis.1
MQRGRAECAKYKLCLGTHTAQLRQRVAVERRNLECERRSRARVVAAKQPACRAASVQPRKLLHVADPLLLFVRLRLG